MSGDLAVEASTYASLQDADGSLIPTGGIMRLQPAWLLLSVSVISGPASKMGADPRSEIRSVLDSIAIDLVAKNRTALTARYDPQGVVFAGNWGLRAVSFDSVPVVYGPKWMAPVQFHWRNVSIDLPSSRHAVVYAQFMWYDSEKDSSLTSYTGVFRNDGKHWRIRSEHESWREPCPGDSATK